jgi:hypothetical protein
MRKARVPAATVTVEIVSTQSGGEQIVLTLCQAGHVMRALLQPAMANALAGVLRTAAKQAEH